MLKVLKEIRLENLGGSGSFLGYFLEHLVNAPFGARKEDREAYLAIVVNDVLTLEQDNEKFE